MPSFSCLPACATTGAACAYSPNSLMTLFCYWLALQMKTELEARTLSLSVHAVRSALQNYPSASGAAPAGQQQGGGFHSLLRSQERCYLCYLQCNGFFGNGIHFMLAARPVQPAMQQWLASERPVAGLNYGQAEQPTLGAEDMV